MPLTMFSTSMSISRSSWSVALAASKARGTFVLVYSYSCLNSSPETNAIFIINCSSCGVSFASQVSTPPSPLLTEAWFWIVREIKLLQSLLHELGLGQSTHTHGHNYMTMKKWGLSESGSISSVGFSKFRTNMACQTQDQIVEDEPCMSILLPLPS